MRDKTVPGLEWWSPLSGVTALETSVLYTASQTLIYRSKVNKKVIAVKSHLVLAEMLLNNLSSTGGLGQSHNLHLTVLSCSSQGRDGPPGTSACLSAFGVLESTGIWGCIYPG